MPEYDSPWKEALHTFYERFLAFFLPWIHADIDWAVDYVSLEQEMHKLLADSFTGKRIADKLVRQHTLVGDETILHIELEGGRESEFERRMDVYNYRSTDHFGIQVVSVALLHDDDPSWRPTEYVFSRWGCERRFKFIPIKILDYRGREAELEADPNPFALMVLAQLLSWEKDDEARAGGKLALLQKLYERKLEPEDIRQFSRYFDWMLPLPKPLDRRIMNALTEFEEKKMPFISMWEKYGQEVFEERGLEKGRREKLLQGIELALDLKFDAAGVAFMAEVRQHTDLAILEAIFAAIKPAQTLDDLRRLLPATNGNG